MTVTSPPAASRTGSERDEMHLQPLASRVTRADVAALRSRTGGSRARELLEWVRSVGSAAVALAFLLLISAVVFGLIAVFSVMVVGAFTVGGRFVAMVPVIVGVGLIAVVLLVWVTRMLVDGQRRDARFGVRWRRAVRLTRFAQANSLRYVRERGPFAEPGSIFAGGIKRRTWDVLSSAQGEFEIGNHQYAGSSASERALRRWGFLRIRLPRPMPHMVLEARSTRRALGRSNLPWSFAGGQKLGLEGDFGRHFTLQIPEGYERDALYFFTPDLMALLIDRAAAFDVEIIDSYLYIYSSRPFRMTDPETWRRAARIVETVGAKARSRTVRYADDRAGWNAGVQVAVQGRRLRQRVSIAGFVLVAVYLLAVLRFLIFG